jgi:hypothetical protein
MPEIARWSLFRPCEPVSLKGKEKPEMVRKRIVYVLMALVVLTLVSATPAMAMREIVECTGQQVNADATDPGTWTTLPNGMVQVRGMVVPTGQVYTTCPEWTTAGTMVINANWVMLPTGPVGPMWGTGRTVFHDGMAICKYNWSGHQMGGGNYRAHAVSTKCEGAIQKWWIEQTQDGWHEWIMLK